MKLPASVKVGPNVFAIIVWNHHEAEGRSSYGEVSHRTFQIRIDARFGLPKAAQTLLHEILHCVCVCWDVGQGTNDEGIVTGITNGLATVWADNPKVAAWIHRGLRSGGST